MKYRQHHEKKIHTALLYHFIQFYYKQKNKERKKKGDASSLTCFTATHHLIGTTTYTVTRDTQK